MIKSNIKKILRKFWKKIFFYFKNVVWNRLKHLVRKPFLAHITRSSPTSLVLLCHRSTKCVRFLAVLLLLKLVRKWNKRNDECRSYCQLLTTRFPTLLFFYCHYCFYDYDWGFLVFYWVMNLPANLLPQLTLCFKGSLYYILSFHKKYEIPWIMW